MALNISHENQSSILRTFENFVNDLPEVSNPLRNESESIYVTGKVWAPVDAVNCQHHILDIPVNYCSKAVLTVPYTHSDYSKLRVLARLLSTKYLHPELRERQGAYGGGARLMMDGTLTFYSYRDPRNIETLDVFDSSDKWFNKNLSKINEQDVFEAKLGVFQTVDAPVPPSNKGCEEFLRRLTPDIKQRHRADLMSVEKEGLRMVMDKYLSEKNILNTGKVIIGPKTEKMDVTKRENELWTVMETGS